MKKRTTYILLRVLGVGVFAGVIALGGIQWRIHQSVQENGRAAQATHPHPGDDGAALMAVIADTSRSLAERNRAVWAVGRLRDPRALPILELACTGAPCQHARDLCQYELQKAIARCGGAAAPSHSPHRINLNEEEGHSDSSSFVEEHPYPSEELSMYHVVESSKDFEQASTDLDAAVKRNGFGVLHIHDLGATLRSKGIAFEEECRVFEVCNPGQAARVLSTDMRLNMALPCRISVYTEGGVTKIGMIKPAQMLASLSTETALAEIAAEVEAKTLLMIDEAK